MTYTSKSTLRVDKLKSVEELQIMKKYWQDHVMDNPKECYIPFDIMKEGNPIIKKVEFQIDNDLYDRMLKITHSNQMASYVLLFGMFSVMICKYADETECTITTPIYNRADMKNSYGSWIFITSRIEMTMCFREYLNRLKNNIVLGFGNQFCSVEEVVRDLDNREIESVLKKNLFIFENIQSKENVMKLMDEGSNYLSLTFKESGNSFKGEFQFSTAHYSENSVIEFTEQYLHLLQQVLMDMNITMGELNLKTEGMSKKPFYPAGVMFRDTNGTTTIKELWEESVYRAPHNIALVDGDHEYSYKEIHKRSSRLAFYLKDQGITKDETVAVLMDYKVDIVIALIALIKLRAVYIPLDSSIGVVELDHICKDNRIRHVLSTNNLNIEGSKWKIIDLKKYKEKSSRVYSLSEEVIMPVCNLSDKVWISYENQGEKEPNITAVNHKNIIDYARKHEEDLKSLNSIIASEFNNSRVNLLLWTMLVNGVTIHLLPKRIYTNNNKLIRYIASNNINMLSCNNEIQKAIVDSPIYTEKIVPRNIKMFYLDGEDNEYKSYLMNNINLDSRDICAETEVSPKDNIRKTYEKPPVVEARNEKEEILLRVFKEVLGKNKIGIYDNFFHIGGDSIKAIQIIGRLKQAGYEMELSNIFKYHTIEQLSEFVTKQSHIRNQGPVVGKGNLLAIQEQFMKNDHEAINQFNHSILLYNRMGFVEEVVQSVFQKLVEHHDALRMVFHKNKPDNASNGDEFYQENMGLDSRSYIFDVVTYPVQDELSFIQKDIEETQEKLDIFHGLLCIVKLYKGKDGDYLSITIHHMVVDGISWHILLEDFQTLYQQLENNQEAILPAKTESYLTWVREVEEYGKSMPKEEKDYWKRYLKISSKSDNDNKLIKSADKYHKSSFSIDERLTTGLLNEANQAFRTNVKDLLLSVLAQALSRWKSENHVSIMMEGHGREDIHRHIDVSRTVGWFTTYYPIYIDVDGGMDTATYIKDVKELLRNVPNNGIGYGILRYILHKECHSEQEQVILFNYLGQGDINSENSDFVKVDLPIRNVIHNKYNMEFPLCLNCIVSNNRLELTLDYHSELYTKESIDDFINIFKDSMKHIISFCMSSRESESTLSDFPLSKLSKKELDEIQAIYSGNKIEDIYTLSLMQEGMLYHWCTSKEKDLYCEQYMYEMEGQIDIEVLDLCIQKLIQTHQVLRTVFLIDGLNIPHQIVLRSIDFKVGVKDLSNSSSLESDLEEYRRRDRMKGFDLNKGPMLRISVILLDSSRFNILFSFHHIIMDGWSVPLLLNDIINLYISNGKAPMIRDEKRQFRSYIKWLNSQNFDAAKTFWKEYLLPVDTITELPYQIKAGVRGKTKKYVYRLNHKETQTLQNIAAECNTTLYQVFQAMWSILLSKYNRNDLVTFGTVISGRPVNLPDAQEIIGLCINTIPVVKKLNPESSFMDYLVESKMENLNENGFYPLAEIQSLSTLRQKLITHIMIYENYPISDELQDGSFARQVGFKFNGVNEFWKTNYDFNLMIIPGEGIEVVAMYNEAAFEPGGAQRIIGHFANIINIIIKNKHTAIKDFELTATEEKQHLMEMAWGPRIPLERAKPIHELISDVARINPEKAIISFKEIRWNYKELDIASDNVAGELIRLGVKAKSVVGVLMNRSHKLLAVLIGILKCGAAYLPMDYNNPMERINYMLEDSNATCLVISKDIERNFTFGGSILEVDSLGDLTIDNENKKIVLPEVNVNDMMYLIYTSGSTGKPKAVCLEHYSVYNFLISMDYELQLNKNAKMLCITTIAFDIFVLEVYYALAYGYEVIIADEREQLDPSLLASLILNNNINTIQMTPSRMKLFLMNEKSHKALHVVDTILIGGEAFSEELLILLKGLTKARIYNVYGPTETTVWSSIEELTNVDDISIGRPIANTSFYIIDDYNHLLPVGVAGELAIGGEGLAREYYNNESITGEKFIPNPFEKEGRIYKTGDIVYLKQDGKFSYIERKDFQLKIHGYRIELGEIENCIRQYSFIVDAVVLPKVKSGETLIVCYYVKKQDFKMEELLSKLHGQLPNYMIPTGFIAVDKLPLNNNGKIDRKELLKLEDMELISDVVVEATDGIEQGIADIWSQYLPNVSLSIEDNFFDVGGHSLKAINICSQAKAQGFDININDLYSNPTIRGLANIVKSRQKRVSSKPIDFKEKSDRVSCLSDKVTVADDQSIKDVMEIFKKDFKFHIEEMKHQFDRSVEELSYHISGTQLLRMYDPQNVVTYIDIENDKSVEELQELLLIIINEQGLLRSKLIKDEDGKYSWKQHSMFTALYIPEVDLRQLKSDTTHYSIERILSNINKGKGQVYESPLYKMVYLRFADNVNRLLVVSNHIIFDGFSSQVLQHRLYSLLSGEGVASNNKISQYVDYVKKIKGGPRNITDEQLFNLCQLDSFESALQVVEDKLCTLDPTTSTTIKFEIPLSNEQISNIDMLEVSFTWFKEFVKDTFSLENIPMVMIHHGRQYGSHNFFSSIGEYIDYIPICYKTGYSDSFTEQVNKQLKIISEHNINFAELITNPLYLEKYKTTQKLHDILHDINEKSLFIFNYQGIEEGNKEDISDIIEVETDYKLNKMIRFSTKIVNGKCCVYIFLPYRMDEEEVERIKRAITFNQER